jgi:hypothetical protein
MNSKILYVTSFNQNLYNISGCNLINSFLDNNLDDEILICYETINNKNYLSYLEKYKNIHLYNLSNNDFLNNWLKDNKNIIPKKYNGTYTGNYKDDLLKKINNEFNYLKCNRIKKLQQNLNDKNKLKIEKYTKNILKKQPYFQIKASLFFRKIASLKYAIDNYKKKFNIIIWVDCDVIIKKKISSDFINNLFIDKYCFYLLGHFRYNNLFRAVESCFLGFKSNIGFNICNEVIKLYENGDFINLFRWDDGFVFGTILIYNDNTIDLCINDGKTYNDNKINSEVIRFSPLKDYIIHNKGSHNKNILPININIENKLMNNSKVNKKIYFIGVGKDNKNNSYYLRGKQIANKLKLVYNFNIITTPSNLISNLNPNYISNSIIFLIKKIKLTGNDHSDEYEKNVFNILKNNNNIIIHDLIDLDYNDVLLKRNFYDVYLTCNEHYKYFLEDKLNDKIIFNIPHHLDFRLNDIKKIKIDDIKLVYFGGISYKKEKNCHFIKNLEDDYNLNYIKWKSDKKITEYINELSKYNVHVDIRNENDMNYKIKPGTKTVVASAFNSIIITTKHPGAYELLGPKYPYYCECNYKSIQNTIEFLKKTFNKKEWIEATKILNNVKNYLNIDNIIKYYYNLILKLG